MASEQRWYLWNAEVSFPNHEWYSHAFCSPQNAKTYHCRHLVHRKDASQSRSITFSGLEFAVTEWEDPDMLGVEGESKSSSRPPKMFWRKFPEITINYKFETFQWSFLYYYSSQYWSSHAAMTYSLYHLKREKNYSYTTQKGKKTPLNLWLKIANHQGKIQNSHNLLIDMHKLECSTLMSITVKRNTKNAQHRSKYKLTKESLTGCWWWRKAKKYLANSV